MQAVTLAEAADELYGLPPGEFIAVRDERARAARAAGRREDAAAIRKLARPTTSAWLVNQLSRGASGQLSRLVELGEGLQEAQRALSGDRLRELSAQRRQVVGDLLAAATGLAEDVGQQASAAVLEEVRATLEAALADQDARDAVQAGRLTKALTYAGLGEVDLAAALAQPRRPQRQPAAAEHVSDSAERDAAAVSANAAVAADAAVSAAEADAAGAAAAVEAAGRDLAAADQQRQFLRRRIAHLERELAQVRDEDARLEQDGHDARRRQAEAERELKAARKRLEKARQAAGGTG
ncbi:MAG: hypothetical protein J2P29_09515 [Actinobacteria bacterium]|nr:hypothetical protein [Actinomycetota bacterium]